VSVNLAAAAVRDQRNFFLFAGLKANGRPGGDIQAHSVSGRSIKLKPGIHFEEMVVAAHLNRAISSVANDYSRHGSAGIQLDFAIR
jgi:hypothetical protein